MRKILFATTALAAVSVASGSIAQESAMMSAAGNDLSIGGYYEFGWASVSDDYKGPNAGDAFTYGDSELYIDFENTADNGLTYGVQLDIEIVDGANHVGYENNGGQLDVGDENGDGRSDGKAIRDATDEASIYIMGDFGEIHLGHDDGAYGRFQTWAPTHDGTFSQDDASGPAGRFLNDNGTANTVADDSRSGTNLAYTTAGAVANQGVAYADDAKIAYISPSFNGFKFGASTQDDDSQSDNPTEFGASYSGDVGPGSLTVKAATHSNNADGNMKRSNTQYGVKYAMGAFSVTLARYTGKAGETELDATEFGVGFKVSDQLSIGASTNNAETDHPASGNPDQEGSFQSVSGSYTIAPGLKTTLALNQFEVEEVGTGARAERKNDGSSIVWQVEMSF